MPNRFFQTVRHLLLASLVTLGSAPGGWANAQDANRSTPLSFQGWKDQQVLEAQNQVLRASARINSLKANKSSGPKAKELANGKLKMLSDTEASAAAEQDLKSAKDSLEAANALKFEDYAEVYIPTLSDEPESLQKLAEKFSKEELTVILKNLMRQPNPSNAKRNAALLDGLTVSAQSKTPQL